MKYFSKYSLLTLFLFVVYSYSTASVCDFQPDFQKFSYKNSKKTSIQKKIYSRDNLNDSPTVDFSFTNNNECSGTSIQFTPNVSGTAPFTYTWDFGDGQTSIAKNPTHAYNSLGCGTETFTIGLTVTDADTIQTAVNKTIVVKQQPDISFFDKDVEIGEEDFSNCSNASIENPNYSITVDNNSASKACIDSYSIDWGDGSNETDVTFPIDHEYTKLGAFNMVITAKGSNNCENSILYIVKNQTNPSGGITSPGTTQDLCVPTDELNFTISGWGANSPGTTYLVNYGDGTEIQITQEEMVAADPTSSANFPIPHSYTTSSCPDASFTVNLTISNACSQTPAAVGNITIITKPEPDFTASPTCVNSSTLFSNKTINGNGKNCTSKSNFTWNFGDGSPIVEQTNTLPQDITHTYTTPGVYNVTLTAINNKTCGENSITTPITISSPPTATITGDANICIGDSSPLITFTGDNGTAPYTFTYKINNDPSKTITTSANGNSTTIQAPTNVAGTFTYSLINVSATSCSQSQTGTAVVVVNSAPTAIISGTDTVCINSDSPRILFKGENGTTPYSFTYNIDGGTSRTITTVSGDTVSLAVPTTTGGAFRYNLTDVSDANVNVPPCTLELSDYVDITVNDQPPTPMVLADYEFCNGETTTQINFTNTAPGTTYEWINSDTSIGLTSIGSDSIESFIAMNNTPDAITSIVTVTPTSLGCIGASQSFKIKVNPAASVIFSEQDQKICSGENATEIILRSETAGVDLSWTVEQPTGISETLPLVGTNSIPSQTLTNTTNEPIDIVYRAKATLTGTSTCPGIENTYTITVFPKPFIQKSLKDTICSGYNFNLTPVQGGNNIVPTGTKYIWDEPTVNHAEALTGISAQNTPSSFVEQTIQNTTSSIATATYHVTPIANDCKGNTFDVIVIVIPNTTLAPVNDITLCNGDFQDEIVFGNSTTGNVYKWSSDNPNIGLSEQSGSNKISSFTAINNGTAPEKATITVESNSELGNSSCDVSQIEFSILVSPAAQVNNPGTQNFCNAEYLSIPFTTLNTSGTTNYEWTNNNLNIGLEASGTGDINFNAVNSEDSVITAVIRVTPTYTNNGNSCTGNPVQFLIKVNPSTTVDQPENQTVCSDNLTSEVTFTGNNPDAVYSWSINNTTIGLPASGTGNIPEFTALNDNSDSVVAVITVVPSLNGCVGNPKDFTITVYPSSVILKQPSSSSICLGETPVPLSVIHTNGVSTPSYQWYSNTSNSYIGATLIPNETNSSFLPLSSNTNTIYYYCVINFPRGGGCNSLTSDIAKVKISPNPIIVLNDEKISRGEELKICPNGKIPIHVRGADSYEWSYGFLGDSVIISQPGDYRVIGTSKIGCKDTFPFSLSYYDFWNYIIESDKDEVTNDQSPVQFSTQDIPGSFYSWDFGDKTIAYGNNVEHTFDVKEDGYIEVHLKVEDPNGCFEEATKRLSTSITSIPNTFTPNGDGINDIFLKGWKIQIFNRNGVLFYEGDDGWDGTYKGKPVPNGTTCFVIIYDSTNKRINTKENYVTILR